MDRADAPSQGFAAVLAEGAFYLDPQGNAADCVDPLRVVGAVERSGAVAVSISPRCPAADGQPPHLLTVEGVVAGRLDQAVRLRLLPGVDDSLLVDGQSSPRDQGQARAAGLIEIADYLKYLWHRNLGHLPRHRHPRTRP